MTGFRWSSKQDIDLAKEVVATKPKKPTDWAALAVTLNNAFSTEDRPVDLKGRGCRERIDLLLKKLRSLDRSFARNATEEEATQLTEMLQEIQTTAPDWPAKIRPVPLKRVVEEKPSSEPDDSMWKGIAKEMLSLGSSSSDSDDQIEEDVSEVYSSTPKRLKSSKGKGKKMKISALELLKVKHEKRAAIKEKELEVRKLELELQKRKWDMEEEERKLRLQLDADTRRAFIELIKKQASV